MALVIILTIIICLFITLWVFAGISYSEGISIKEVIFGGHSSADIEHFKDKTISRLRMLEQEREIDYAMLKETRDDVKKLKSQLYTSEGD